MKRCSDCNIEMVENTNLHTDYVGGVKFEEQLYLDYDDEINGSKMLFSNKKAVKEFDDLFKEIMT